MIAVDSSAILAMTLGEPDAKRFVGPLAGAPCMVGWPTLFEVFLVLRGKHKTIALEAAELWLGRCPNAPDAGTVVRLRPVHALRS